MRKIAAWFLLSLPIFLSAEDYRAPCYVPGEPLCDETACAIYSAYGGIDLNCGWDVNAWGEFLYWRPIPGTTFDSNTYEGDPLGSTQLTFRNIQGYKPAFRVGLGMTLHDLDDWTLNVDYFWYHHSFSKTNSVDPPTLMASTLNGAFTWFPIYSSITTGVEYHYDIIGVNLQRANYLTRRVILSPFLGLKWLDRKDIISQNLIQVAGGAIDRQSTTMRHSSVALGAGMDGYFLLCWGLYLIGKADVALHYAYKRKMNDLNSPAIGAPIEITQKIKHMGILGKGGLGLGWGSYFCCNRYHVDLSASFDFFADIVKLAFAGGMWGSPAQALIGLTVRGQFDF